MNRRRIAIYLSAILALALLVGGLSIMTSAMIRSHMNSISVEYAEVYEPD